MTTIELVLDLLNTEPGRFLIRWVASELAKDLADGLYPQFIAVTLEVWNKHVQKEGPLSGYSLLGLPIQVRGDVPSRSGYLVVSI